MTATVELVKAACDIAMRGAVEWAAKHGKTALAHERLDALTAALKRHVVEAMPAALADAKKALTAGGMVTVRGGMKHVAEMNFTAGMLLAGIAAADEVLHNADEDCTLGPDDCCKVCGVYHGDPCQDCGGRGFHRSGCATV
jgi:hypothetical protein